MDKILVWHQLKEAMEALLRRHQQANRQASAGATDEQSRAETKWDTSGLEASYLARGHARQF
ncbi:MAG: transcription elongation factor GreAB, partial [Verrucomicrobiota bacterium]|nr:transcription elongation factor GreAB [Verrucomicrobiota bacterium]